MWCWAGCVCVCVCFSFYYTYLASKNIDLHRSQHTFYIYLVEIQQFDVIAGGKTSENGEMRTFLPNCSNEKRKIDVYKKKYCPEKAKLTLINKQKHDVTLFTRPYSYTLGFFARLSLIKRKILYNNIYFREMYGYVLLGAEGSGPN